MQTKSDDGGLLKEMWVTVGQVVGQVDDAVRRKIERDLLKVLAKFRAELTLEESAHWSDEGIIHTFLNLNGDIPCISDGLAAKKVIREASTAELARDDFKPVQRAAKLYDILENHGNDFWGLVVTRLGFSMDRGKYMVEGGRDKGMIRYAGGEREVANIAAQSEANVYGVHSRGDFVPGSGGLTVWRGKAFDGEGVEDGGVIPDIGHGPDDNESAEQVAQRLRNKWARERNNKLNDTAAD